MEEIPPEDFGLAILPDRPIAEDDVAVVVVVDGA